MTYTEIKQRNKSNYYYRVLSIRSDKKIKKQRLYLGKNLSKNQLLEKQQEADKQLKQINKELKKITPMIIKILKKYHVKKAGIFGSYARNEQKKKSDIDILIELPRGMGLEFVGLHIELQEKLKKKVDLVTYSSIHPMLKERVLRDEVKIL